MIRKKISQEGEIYQDMENLKVTPDTSSESSLFFVWPLDIVHVIDEVSPFYDVSAADLARERFELFLVMEGTNETSNMTFQAR
jgi:potassium inwardly-rectifying channel subfamily J